MQIKDGRGLCTAKDIAVSIISLGKSKKKQKCLLCKHTIKNCVPDDIYNDQETKIDEQIKLEFEYMHAIMHIYTQ